MILICTQKCFILDRTIKPGQAVDVPAEMLDLDVVMSSFAKPENAEAAKEAEAQAQNAEAGKELTVVEMKRRLDEMGVAYKGNASRETLRRILETQLSVRDEP